MKQATWHLRASIALIALIAVTAPKAAGKENPTFEKANADYGEEHFKEAHDGYQSLVNSGLRNANLFYNLGNTWFRMGNLGEAILNYERTLALDPRHPEATANLTLVRDEARALELQRTGFERYAAIGTSTQYSLIAAIAIWCALFCATRLVLERRRSVALVLLTILSGLVFAGAIFAIYSLETGTKGAALAIVTGKNVEARLATADSAKSVLVLPPGSQIRILSERGDWVYAALPNDTRGWIPASDTKRVRM